jgi:hypothetical protein
MGLLGWAPNSREKKKKNSNNIVPKITVTDSDRGGRMQNNIDEEKEENIPDNGTQFEDKKEGKDMVMDYDGSATSSNEPEGRKTKDDGENIRYFYFE